MEISILPVTRIEGHGKVLINLDDRGDVKSAHFHVMELRGFEKLLHGTALEDLPKFTPRICGVCPVAHHLVSAKACDNLLGIEPPEPAKKLRELMHMAHYIHSHAAQIFVLSAADFLIPDEPAKRNVIGIVEKDPELAKKALTIRKVGQIITTMIGGRPTHPVTAVPGGISKSLSKEDKDNCIKMVKEALAIAEETAKILVSIINDNIGLADKIGKIETAFLGTVREGGVFNLYDGKLRLMEKDGKITEFEPQKYLEHIEEKGVDYSYIKYPYIKRLGYPGGMYRVGPLARINVCDRMGTEKADALLTEYRKRFGRPVQATILYHYARAIELVYACERAMELLNDPQITSDNILADVPKLGAGRGIAVVEAPRGVLIHDYETDSNGLIKDLNFIVATGHNAGAIDTSVEATARALIKGGNVDESILHKIEMTIRCYDPCLSCATHTLDGGFPTVIEIYDHKGEMIKKLSNLAE